MAGVCGEASEEESGEAGSGLDSPRGFPRQPHDCVGEELQSEMEGGHVEEEED